MSHIQYPFPAVPDAATLTAVAPGVHWLRMPLPFQLDHINLWLLDDGEGWALVDTGLGNETTKDIWRRVFAECLGGRPITRLLVTHCHPDHMGLAGWFAGEFGLRMWATKGEWMLGRLLSIDTTPEFLAAQMAFYRRAGFPDDVLAALASRGNGYAARVVPPPVELSRLHDGDGVSIGGREWRVIVGTGHSPEHACLYCAELGVLIAGDQVLPKITPVIGVWESEPEANPLKDYLGSLDKFHALPPGVLVLPSHNFPFLGLPARIADIRHHHEKRLAHTLQGCDDPVTGWQLLHTLFRRKLDLHQTALALGETLAHANYLIRQGAMVRDAAADGAWRYRRA